MSRPTIGITASVEEMRSGEWRELTVGTPAAYCRAVQQAGGRAIVLAPDDEDAKDAAEALDLLDGLIASGASADLDPRHYTATERHPETKPGVAARDRYELAMIRGALERELPLLGVCRGMQMLNVACGGTLIQHLPDVVGHTRHTGVPGQYAEHEVRLAAGSLAARAAGGEHEAVRSYHHQGVDELGGGLEPSAWSTYDGIVEAIELRDRPFVLGVLWHPEEDEASSVIGALVSAAAARRSGAPR